MAFRRPGVSALARAVPPIRPRATAALFRPSGIVSDSSSSPVAIRMTWTALEMTSAGRLWPLGVRGMLSGKLTMHRHVLAFVAFALFTAPLSAQTPRNAPEWDYLDGIRLPPDQQDSATRQVVQMLAAGKVPTSGAAVYTIIGFPTGDPFRPYRGLGADETVEVAGLFYVGIGGPIRPGRKEQRPELVWEVRFGNTGLRDIYWVVARTGAVIQVFPALGSGIRLAPWTKRN